MRNALKLLLSFTLAACFDCKGWSQSSIITTYAGHPLPIAGIPATAQSIGYPTAVLADGRGGFYLGSDSFLTHVAANGLPTVIAGGENDPLGRVAGLALDAAGNLFFSEQWTHRIRRVSPSGQLISVAGTGIAGYSGDNGPATAAQFSEPRGLALDSAGNLFIADSRNGRIRKIAPSGIITTVAAGLGIPVAVATDQEGNLFIASSNNLAIRKIDATGVVTIVATTGRPSSTPVGIAIDPAGNLLVADSYYAGVWKINPARITTPFAGRPNDCSPSYYDYGCPGGFSGDGGPAAFAELRSPNAVAVDEAGNLFIADSDNYRIRKVTSGGSISTVAGNGAQSFSGDNGPSSLAQLSWPSDVAVDIKGNLFIAEYDNNRIRKVSPQGTITTVAGNGGPAGFPGDGGFATQSALRGALSVAVDGDGNLWIADRSTNRIRKVNPQGIISTVAGNGGRGFSGDGGLAALAQLNDPHGVAVDSEGNLFIADANNSRIRKVTPQGVITTVAGNGTPGFSGDGGPATAAQLNRPSGVASDRRGNLFIADYRNSRIRKVTPEGVITTVAGNGTAAFGGDNGLAVAASLASPYRVTVDAAGNLYIADVGNSRVRKVTPEGVITTVAGNGTRGFEGDGGPATAASLRLDWPSGVAVDAAGNLFIADTGNNRVRIVTPPNENVPFSLTERGGVSLRTTGMSARMAMGYAAIDAGTGEGAPAGLAIISFRQGGVLISEASVPASSPIQLGRIYAEIRGSINTGLAIANPNSQPATVAFHFTDGGGDFGHGALTIPPRNQVAAFLNQSPFNGRDSMIGSLTFNSSVPIAVTAIRGRINERGEWLMTTLSVEDLTAPSQPSVVFPHFADGGGWMTQIVLVNRTDRAAGGTVRFLGTSGQSAMVRVGNTTADRFAYRIPPGASEVLQTSGVTSETQTGWVQVVPDPDTGTPGGLAIFTRHDRGVTAGEFGVPAVKPGLAFRLYGEGPGATGNTSIHTGIAVANVSETTTTVTLELHRLDGTPTGLIGTLQIPPHGQTAMFMSQVPGFETLPAGFRGIIRASSGTPISIIGLRSRYNERGDFLLVTTPPVEEGAAPHDALYFPHVADSGGYTTEFILFGNSPGRTQSGTLRFIGQPGSPWDLALQPPDSSNSAAPQTGGMTVSGLRGLRVRTDKAAEGYVLFAPMAADTTFLINNDGNVVRTWKSDLLPSAWVYMRDNGNVLRGGVEPSISGISGGGQGGRFQEFTFDGDLLWDFSFQDEKHLPHHDVAILPNGNLLAIVWELKTAEEARQAGRREGFIPNRGLWPDMIVELEPRPPNDAKVVWEWHSWDHLIQDESNSLGNYGVPTEHPGRIDVNGDLSATATPPRNPASDIFHTNSIAYNPTLDQILISVPTFNEIWVIDHGTTTEQARGSSGGRYGKGGDILYRWGNPEAYGRGTEADRQLGFQHDARWIPEGRPGAGHMTVFSNRTPGPEGDYTKVYEFAPPVAADGGYTTPSSVPFGPGAPSWTYSAPASLDARIMSGAERLANGNTLISSGPQGRIFEVTPAGEIAWEYWSPYSGGANTFAFFRAAKIPADHAGLSGRRLR